MLDKVYAMITQKETPRNVKKGSGDGRGKERIQCGNFQMPEHSKDNFYKIIGCSSGLTNTRHVSSGKFNARNVSTNNANISLNDGSTCAQLSSDSQ